ncbi:hypothetical protein BH09MYX1_BH09MYX1_09580 [soil metagenome]
MVAFDTTAQAHRIQIEALRRLGPEGRIAQAIRMSVAAREMAKSGIKKRHPEYTDDDLVRALVWLLHGEPLARTIWRDGARAP